MLTKIVLIFIFFSSVLSATETNEYTIKSYKNKTFFKLAKINMKNVKLIKEPSKGCVLFYSKKYIYCNIKNEKKIQIQITTTSNKNLKLNIINDKYLEKRSFYEEGTLNKKFKSCIVDNKKIQANMILLNQKFNIYKKRTLNTLNKKNAIITKMKKNNGTLSTVIETNKQDIIDIKRKCTIERNELVSILRKKTYKNISKYDLQNQLIIELENNRTFIKKIQHSNLQKDILIEKLKAEKEELEKRNKLTKDIFE